MTAGPAGDADLLAAVGSRDLNAMRRPGCQGYPAPPGPLPKNP
jgi:hypothetical protein